MDDKWRMSMGAAIEQAYDDALAAWREEHAPGMRRDEVLSGPVRTIEIDSALHAGGILNVTVKVYGRRRFEDVVYFYRYMKDAGLYMASAHTTSYRR